MKVIIFIATLLSYYSLLAIEATPVFVHVTDKITKIETNASERPSVDRMKRIFETAMPMNSKVAQTLEEMSNSGKVHKCMGVVYNVRMRHQRDWGNIPQIFSLDCEDVGVYPID